MRQLTTIALATSLLLPVGCARSSPPRATTLTSARVSTEAYREAERAAEEVTRGRYVEALALADRSVALLPNDAWAHYQRAVALRHLGRVDAAVSAYRDAETRFVNDPSGKSIAIYGRARALDDVGRCDEARRAYGEYSVHVRSRDPRAADQALVYADECRALESASAEDALLDEMTHALVSGEYIKVIELEKKRSPSTPQDPWIDYNLGAALTDLGRTDEALIAFGRAEHAFGDTPDGRRGRSLSIWGRARALTMAKRCREAAVAFDDYAKLVSAVDPDAARLATTYARACPTRT